MKILVVINLYPPHALGGYELSCQDVVRRWRANGHEVSVLTTTTRFPGVVDDPAETGVYRQLEWYWADHEIQRPPPRERLRIERANARRFDAIVAQVAPDVASLWAMGGMSMALVSRAARSSQAVLVIEDDWLTYGPKVDAWLSAWQPRPGWVGRLASSMTSIATTPPTLSPAVPVAFASDYLRRRATERGLVTFSTSEVVPLGVDLIDFPLREVEDRPWQGRLLCVGRVEPRKGFEVVVRALADLPGTTLRLVGPSDGHLDDLLATAADLGVADRITTGAVPRAELGAVYREADAFVFPSRWEEPFGIVPLEAMTQATPVIATRRGGSAEFLTNDENCLAIPIDDVAAVVGAVRRLEADPMLRRRLATNGLRTAASYDVSRFAERLEAIHAATMAT